MLSSVLASSFPTSLSSVKTIQFFYSLSTLNIYCFEFGFGFVSLLAILITYISMVNFNI